MVIVWNHTFKFLGSGLSILNPISNYSEQQKLCPTAKINNLEKIQLVNKMKWYEIKVIKMIVNIYIVNDRINFPPFPHKTI